MMVTDKDQVQIDQELDALFGEAQETVGVVPPELTRLVVADRKNMWQQRIAGLQVDLQVAKALKDEGQIKQIREAGRKALEAIRALKEIEASLPSAQGR